MEKKFITDFADILVQFLQQTPLHDSDTIFHMSHLSVKLHCPENRGLGILNNVILPKRETPSTNLVYDIFTYKLIFKHS